MIEISKMFEDELRVYMKTMEKSKEGLKFQEQRIWKEEEEQIYAAMGGLYFTVLPFSCWEIKASCYLIYNDRDMLIFIVEVFGN